MGALPKKWLKWIALLLGVAGMLTPALLGLGWIPQNQALNAAIFLLGFIVFDGAARGSEELAQAPELLTSSESYYHELSGFFPETKHEALGISRGDDILTEEQKPYLRKLLSALRSEKQLHVYPIVAGRVSELSEESFQRRFALERDPSLEGRMHYRVVDSLVSFGCQVFDQKHWTIDFPPNPADVKGAGIVFKNHPEGARLVASFIRHQWLERPGVTMSLSEAYEKWKALQNSAIPPE
jgi:hypothetical protein